jgi:hypothetical protein
MLFPFKSKKICLELQSETEQCQHVVYTGFPSIHEVTVESSHNTQNMFNLHRLSKHSEHKDNHILVLLYEPV